jgi:hypothetical protein
MELFESTYFKQKDSQIDFEVGDSKSGIFLPQFKTKHWGNESNLSIRLDASIKGATVHKEKDVVIWQNKDKIARFYELNNVFEQGGFEFEVEFAKMPQSNIVNYTIESKGLRFQKQGLTPEMVKAGFKMHEDVVGSYSVYHATKKHNQYKTGKAGHIPKPYLVDAKGNKAWCDMTINMGMLSIEMPRAFLKTATYPVILDPTFGYTSVGASNAQFSDYIDCCEFTPASSGTVTEFHAYVEKLYGGTAEFRMALYDKSGSQPDALQGNNTASITADGTAAWKSSTSVTGTLGIVGSTPSFIAVGNNDAFTVQYNYDSGATDQLQWSPTVFSTWTWQNPIGTVIQSFPVEISMYATYTASGGVNTTNFFRMF